MSLRRFADADERLVMRRRDDWSVAIPTTVRRACAESGFYAIPTDQVADTHQVGHDPEIVERILSEVEGEAKETFDRIVTGQLPLSAHDKYELSLFLSLQVTRGWAYREQMQELRDLVVPHLIDEALTDERIREHLRTRGEAADPIAIENFRRNVRGSGITLNVSQAARVQQSLRDALQVVIKHLFARSWRILYFEEPCLLTSDHPFAYWAPPGLEGPFGVGNAPVVYYPIDRKIALTMHRDRVRETCVRSGPVRAKQINRAVAIEAAKWIFHHPDDDLLVDEEFVPRAKFVDEFVSRRADGREVRELRQLVRRENRGPT